MADVRYRIGLSSFLVDLRDPLCLERKRSAMDRILRLPGDKEGKETCIGKIVSLDESGMSIQVQEAKKELQADTECKIKFRLPLFRKGHYFEAIVDITEAVHSKSGIQLKCLFTSMNEEDRKSINQFVQEMKFLRSEAKND